MANKIEVKDLMEDLKAIGLKLEEAGRALATTAGKTVKTVAAETLDMAEDAIALAQKNLKKARAEMKKRT
jgi:hypothetical protein